MPKVKTYLIIFSLTIIAFFIKVINLDASSLGADECFSVYSAQLPPLDIITWLNTGDNPPLWELILHYWIVVRITHIRLTTNCFGQIMELIHWR